MTDYDGKKTFVISTTNFLGGKNYFMSICYLFVGCMCIVFAIAFLIGYLKRKRQDRKKLKK